MEKEQNESKKSTSNERGELGNTLNKISRYAGSSCLVTLDGVRWMLRTKKKKIVHFRTDDRN